jgi:hypothetical protein
LAPRWHTFNVLLKKREDETNHEEKHRFTAMLSGDAIPGTGSLTRSHGERNQDRRGHVHHGHYLDPTDEER